MPVSHEIKSQLAKLLATEDLVVEHRKCETAQFNVHTRVLTLPMWEKASNTVYDLLVGHEVGHALYTPDEDWSKNTKVSHQFVNVVEDVRIEKLMKRRYAGLAKTFYNGYKELSDDDFFQIGDDKLETYNLADRANLKFKIGNFVNVPIENGEEQEIIDLIASVETFADTLIAAEALYKYCKQAKEQETADVDIKMNLPQSESSSSSNSSSDLFDQEEGENEQSESSESQSPSDHKEENEKDQTPSDKGGETSDPEVKTMSSLEDALKELINNDGKDNAYIEVPKLNLENIIIPVSEIHDKCRKEWGEFIQRSNCHDCFTNVDRMYVEFKRSSQKEVNYLVKEFECRKAADSYARASVSKTGILDCTKLHTYKYNEDLFKKVATLADGKNHGLVFVLDWSGSMGNVMLDTIKQLFNLVWFCKKVSIPFEVYAFTTDYPIAKRTDGKSSLRSSAYVKKEDMFHIGEWFSMMNLISSKVNASTLEEHMKNIFRLGYSFKGYTTYTAPSGLYLSGTPLNESMVALHQIIPKFQKENKLQKVQCVVLTDGEGYDLKYHRQVKRGWENEPYLGLNSLPENSFLRDRKTGNTYKIDTFNLTDVLLQNLRDSFTNTNFIGIRVLESRDASFFIRRYYKNTEVEYDKMISDWKKGKSFAIKSSGYHVYFGLSSSALSQETGFAVSEDASKNQIKNAFAKSLMSKKMNKKVLSEFIDLVA